jgi:hypothetical protein
MVFYLCTGSAFSEEPAGRLLLTLERTGNGLRIVDAFRTEGTSIPPAGIANARYVLSDGAGNTVKSGEIFLSDCILDDYVIRSGEFRGGKRPDVGRFTVMIPFLPEAERVAFTSLDDKPLAEYRYRPEKLPLITSGGEHRSSLTRTHTDSVFREYFRYLDKNAFRRREGARVASAQPPAGETNVKVTITVNGLKSPEQICYTWIIFYRATDMEKVAQFQIQYGIEGNFTLPEGDYIAECTAQYKTDDKPPIYVQLYPDKQIVTGISVKSGQVASVNFKYKIQPIIHGYLTDADGKPVYAWMFVLNKKAGKKVLTQNFDFEMSQGCHYSRRDGPLSGNSGNRKSARAGNKDGYRAAVILQS